MFVEFAISLFSEKLIDFQLTAVVHRMLCLCNQHLDKYQLCMRHDGLIKLKPNCCEGAGSLQCCSRASNVWEMVVRVTPPSHCSEEGHEINKEF